MLQKFLRRSFRRASKDFKSDDTTQNKLLFSRSQSLPGGDKLDAELLKSPSTISELEVPSRKVTFKESIDSPEKSIEEDKLFDDSVLEAFQEGNLSIADFLKSPHPSPKLHKSNISELNSPDKERSKSVSNSPQRKLSLLDRAHSVASSRSNKSLTKQKHVVKQDTNLMPCASRDNDDESELSSGNTTLQDMSVETPQLKQSANSARMDKPRFSKSLETLAQQVFGDDYETYLSSASKSPVKISLLTTNTVSIDSTGSNVTQSSYDSVESDLPKERKYIKHAPIKKERQNLKKPRLTHSKSSLTVEKVKTLSKQLDITRSMDVSNTLPEEETGMESWTNENDLRSSLDSTNEVSELDAINEDEVVDCIQNEDSKIKRRAKSLGALKDGYIIKPGVVSPVRRRIPKSDSQIVHLGSFSDNEYNELSASDSSFINIHFPPPPPINEELTQPISEEFQLNESLLDNASYSSYELDDANDPLINSLMSIVPLPNEPEQLIPVLSTALSEIITEIVASRRKLNNVLKAIQVHQQILKEQCQQIKTHHREISELKKTAYALNNYQAFYRYDKTSKSNRSSRQSREMVELNTTLDKLLQQCSTLQKQHSSEEGVNMVHEEGDTLEDVFLKDNDTVETIVN